MLREAILVALTCLPAAAAYAQLPAARPAGREFGFDIWDWTRPCQDLPTFQTWVADLKKVGVTRVEISAPWSRLEPEAGKIDTTFIAERLAIVKELGMGLRVRINSYYGGATPGWYGGDRWKDFEGKPPGGTPLPVSITDEWFWEHYGKVCTEIARRFKGEDVYYSAFIGVHAELKWAGWWSYDDATLALWRDAIHANPRAEWLRRLAGDAPLPEKPGTPKGTAGTPDNSPATKAWIGFREKVWRDAIERFTACMRAGDADVKISSPLGESFRKESAEFSNLDYWGLSRGAQQVVHSYDFYWHPKDPAWQAGAAVASFRGITGLPVEFEFDGPALTDQLQYSVEHLLELAKSASDAGAGMKTANYSYSETLPSTYPAMQAFGKIAAEAGPAMEPAKDKTILLFVSKWANYCYREKTQWLHEAQFGAWKMLKDRGCEVRFICEDNLDEADLLKYRGLYVAMSPGALLPREDQVKLAALEKSLPSVIEVRVIPAAKERIEPPATQSSPATKEGMATCASLGDFAVTTAGLPIVPARPKQEKPSAGIAEFHGTPLLVHEFNQVTVGYPLAYLWLHGTDRAAQEKVLDWAMKQTIEKD